MKRNDSILILLTGLLLLFPLKAVAFPETETSLRNAEEVVKKYESGQISEEGALRELERIERAMIARKMQKRNEVSSPHSKERTRDRANAPETSTQGDVSAQAAQAIGTSMIRTATAPGSPNIIGVIGRILVGYIIPFILGTTAFIAAVFIGAAAYSSGRDRYNQYRIRYEVHGFRNMVGTRSFGNHQNGNIAHRHSDLPHSGQVPAHLV